MTDPIRMSEADKALMIKGQYHQAQIDEHTAALELIKSKWRELHNDEILASKGEIQFTNDAGEIVKASATRRLNPEKLRAKVGPTVWAQVTKLVYDTTAGNKLFSKELRDECSEPVGDAKVSFK